MFDLISFVTNSSKREEENPLLYIFKEFVCNFGGYTFKSYKVSPAEMPCWLKNQQQINIAVLTNLKQYEF